MNSRFHITYNCIVRCFILPPSRLRCQTSRLRFGELLCKQGMSFSLKNISKGIQLMLEMFTCLVAICKGLFNNFLICVYNIEFTCRFMFVIGIVSYLCVFSRSIPNLDSIPGPGSPIGLELGRYQVQLFD